MSRVDVPRKLLTCPVCHNEIRAQLTLDVDLVEPDGKLPDETPIEELRTDYKLVGFFVQHDCRPRATRSVGGLLDDLNRAARVPRIHTQVCYTDCAEHVGVENATVHDPACPNLGKPSVVRR